MGTLRIMIIVTGGAGFIGSAFISKLNSEGIKDIIVVDNIASTGKWRNLVGKSFREYVHKDRFLDLLLEKKISGAIDGVVHLGACSSTTEANVDYLLQNNLTYSQKLAEYCVTHGIRFIYASSAATYGDGANSYEDNSQYLSTLRPLNPYGFSKHLFDLWGQRFGILHRMAGLKFFNVYGPNEYYKNEMSSVVWKAFNKIQEGGSFSLFKSHRPDYKDGEQKRDFVYVKDCCNVVWWLLNNPTVNGLYNVGSGRARTWNDLATAVFSAMKRPVKIEYIPMPEKLINQYQYFTEAPMKRLPEAGYQSPLYSLEDGIQDYVGNHLLASDQHL